MDAKEPAFGYPELLQLVGRSEAVADLLLQKFATLAPDTFKRIEALATNPTEANAGDLRREAHSLKGSSSYIFAKKLTAACFEMQTADEEKQLEKIPALLATVRSEFEIVQKEIQEHLNSRAAAAAKSE
jgi:HPt (histidine-containing phosphotransfer) domain-containing protein